MAVRQQVEYLLSPAVLQHDLFLRTSITTNGWLPLQLLVATDWVAALTSDPSVVTASLQDSALVEVKGPMARPDGAAASARATRTSFMMLSLPVSVTISEHAKKRTTDASHALPLGPAWQEISAKPAPFKADSDHSPEFSNKD